MPCTRCKERPRKQQSPPESERMPSKKRAREDSNDITTVSKKRYEDLLKLYEELRMTKDDLPIQNETISEMNSIASKTSADVDVDFTPPDKQSLLLDVNVPPIKDVVKPDVVLEKAPKEKNIDSAMKTSANASTE